MAIATDTEPATAGPGPAEPPAAIAIANLWKIYGRRADRIVGSPEADLSRAELRARTDCLAAVRDVSFDVRPGEIFVVMGLSGSGKSTLVRCLTRLVEPTSGSIRIDGEDVRAMGRRQLRELRRHRVAMVFQHFGLLPHRRVIDNVAYGLEVQRVARPARHRRAREMLALVGLEGFADHHPHELSGGMQQRVGLARALAVDPGVLLFDEPFSALDPLIRREMQAELCRLQVELGTTAVFITHDVSEAFKLGDRIAVLRDGALIQVGRPEELVAEPADSYVADFVREVPRADVLTVRRIARPARPQEPLAGRPLAADTLIREVVEPVVRSDLPLPVVADGKTVGVVDRDQLLPLISGSPALDRPAEADRFVAPGRPT